MRFLVFTSSGNPVTDYISDAKDCLYSDVFNHSLSGYYIDVEDLSSLLSLIKDHPVIIDRVDNLDISNYVIEIYDSYRE